MSAKRKRVSSKNLVPSKKKKTCNEEPEICNTPKLTSVGIISPKNLFRKKESKYTGYVRYIYIDNVKHGICVLCEKKFGENKIKPIPMKMGNTSGVKHHYRSYHVKEYAILFDEPSLSKQTTIDELLILDGENINKEAEEVNMERVFVCWISINNLPINFFDDETTQNFFNLINSDLNYPRRNVLAGLLESNFVEMRDNLKSVLTKNKSKIAFTMDAWWARSKTSYYAVTVHFIDDEWDLMSTVLDMLPSEGRHTGKDIAGIFQNALEFFEITEKLIGKKFMCDFNLFIVILMNLFFNYRDYR